MNTTTFVLLVALGGIVIVLLTSLKTEEKNHEATRLAWKKEKEDQAEKSAVIIGKIFTRRTLLDYMHNRVKEKQSSEATADFVFLQKMLEFIWENMLPDRQRAYEEIGEYLGRLFDDGRLPGFFVIPDERQSES